MPVGVTLMAAPMKFDHMSPFVVDLCFWGGILLTVTLFAAAVVFTMQDERVTHLERKSRMLPLIGMIACGVGFLFFGYWYMWSHNKKIEVDIPKGVPKTSEIKPSDVVTFDAAGNSTISVHGLEMKGDPIRVVRAMGNSTVSISNATIIGPNAGPIQLPTPPESLQSLSNAELNLKLSLMAADLRKIQQDYDLEQRNLLESSAGKNKNLNHQEWEARNQEMIALSNRLQKSIIDKYHNQCGELVSLVVQRVGPISSPVPMVSQGYETYRLNRSVQLGLSMIGSNMTAARPSDVANALEYISSLLHA